MAPRTPEERLRQAWRYLWASPTTLPGLAIALLSVLGGGRMQRHTGALEVYGGLATWLLRYGTLLPGGAVALTLGHVVLGVNATALEVSREHERVHVRQVERWGPLFLPAYGAASVIAWWRGQDAYRDNMFEREAYAVSG